MVDEQLLQLAKAMELIYYDDYNDWHWNALRKRFSPHLDANDDYAVLEWMIGKYDTQEIEAAFDHQGFGHRWAYDLGTYAKAAIDLINGEVLKCSDCQQALRGAEEPTKCRCGRTLDTVGRCEYHGVPEDSSWDDLMESGGLPEAQALKGDRDE